MPDPREIHWFDQKGEWLSQLAPMLWGYFARLTNEGFTRIEALELTLAIQDRAVDYDWATSKYDPQR